MKKFIADFKAFISRGNVIDMAVGIIVGNAFTAIVKSLVNDIIMPFIAIFTGKVNFTEIVLVIGNTKITYGTFIQEVINFLIIAFVVFCMIKLIGFLQKKREKEAAEEPAPAEPSEEVLLLREIRDSLKK